MKKHSQQPSPVQDYQLSEVDWVLVDMAFDALRGILGDDERARRKIEKLTHNKRLRWARLRHNAGWFAKPEPLSPELSRQIALEVGYPFSDDGLVPDYSQPELRVFIDDNDQSDEFMFLLSRADLVAAFSALGDQTSGTSDALSVAKPNELSKLVWMVVQTLDEMEREGLKLIGISKKRLADLVMERAPHITVSLRTLGRAEAWRQKRGQPDRTRPN